MNEPPEHIARVPGLPRIVVVGAGFAGLAFCKKFKGRAEVVLIDKQNHHLYQPLLYQVAMSGLSGPDIAAPIRSVFRRDKRVRTHMAEVKSIDLERKLVRVADVEVEYDKLVFAAGGATHYFGNDHWRDRALGLKTLDDAMLIRRRVLTSFERAENRPGPEEAERLMTIVVVGGGPTGVELAGAMAELAKSVFKQDFRHIDPSAARVLLIESSERVLGMYPPKRSEEAKRQLEELGVELILGRRVTEVHDDRVVLSDGETIPTRNVLWGTGVVASEVTQTFGDVPLDRAGRVRVRDDLSIPGHPDAFVVGDAAAIHNPDGTPVPGLAPAAMQMGGYVAGRLTRELRGEAPEPEDRFTYLDKGSMATIGRSKAVAQVRGVGFDGFPAWFLWVTIHLFFLVSFRNKVSVFVKWIVAYFQFGRGARIIYDPNPRTADDVLVDPAADADRGGPGGEGAPGVAAASRGPTSESAGAAVVAHPT